MAAPHRTWKNARCSDIVSLYTFIFYPICGNRLQGATLQFTRDGLHCNRGFHFFPLAQTRLTAMTHLRSFKVLALTSPASVANASGDREPESHSWGILESPRGNTMSVSPWCLHNSQSVCPLVLRYFHFPISLFLQKRVWTKKEQR